MVFVISYAIASHSILFPNSPLNGDTVIAVLRRSYWNIYGELFLDEIAGKLIICFIAGFLFYSLSTVLY